MSQMLSKTLDNLGENQGLFFYVYIILIYLFAILNAKLFVYLAIPFGLLLLVKQLLRQEHIYDLIIVIGLLLTIQLLSIAKNISVGLLFLPHMLAALGVAAHLSRVPVNHRLFDFLFALFIVYFFCTIFFLGWYPEDTVSGSKNRVATLLLGLFAAKILALRWKNTNTTLDSFSLIQIALFGATTLICNHVGGLVCACIIALMFFLLPIRNLLLWLTFFAISGFLIAWTFLFAQNFFFESDQSPFFELLNSKANAEHLMSNVRYKIWSEYLDAMTLLRVLFGADLRELFAENSLHNSYLILHQRGGALGILLLCFVLLGIFRSFWDNPLFFLPSLALFVRGLSDTVFFATSAFDFLMLVLILMSLNIKKSSVKTVGDNLKLGIFT